MSSAPQAAPSSGARSGALLAVATAASIVAAYVFLLAAGRILGSEDYGSLAALLGLLAIVLIPAGALQMAVSREVSRRVATGDLRRSDGSRAERCAPPCIATVPLMVVALALAKPLSHVLHIDSVGDRRARGLLSLSTALVFPLAMGVLQGLQRFTALGTLYIFPWLVRLVVLGDRGRGRLSARRSRRSRRSSAPSQPPRLALLLIREHAARRRGACRAPSS